MIVITEDARGFVVFSPQMPPSKIAHVDLPVLRPMAIKQFQHVRGVVVVTGDLGVTHVGDIRQPPRFVFPHGPDVVRKVGVCSGAASDLLEAAALAGCDMFVTGELAERAGDLAKELQITLVAAGHVATEVFGPMRLADELRARFPAVETQFVLVPSPL